MRGVFLMLALLGLTLSGCGADWFPEQKATSPNGTTVTAFAFLPATVTGVAVNSPQTSNTITVALSGSSAAVSVTGGLYSINAGPFVSTAGTVNNNDRVTVQHTAASASGQTVTTTLTIGDKSATFSSTTASGTSGLPLAFAPAYLFKVAPGSKQTSSVATISISGSSAPISITGGTYSVNGGPFTTAAGTVKNGDLVLVQHFAADGTTQTTVTTTLTVGVSSATFTSTTANVAAQTVDASGVADTVVTSPATTLHLVPGTYTISVASGTGQYSLNGANGDFSNLDQPVTLSDGKILFFQDFASGTPNDVATTVFTIDGVPITFNVHTNP